MVEEFELSEMMNHHPAYPGIWVPYNGWRLKDRYDIKLKTGEVWQYYYPNGGSFSKWTSEHEGPSRVEDDEIAEIRLKPDEEITEKYHFRGEERLKRNVDMFGGALPDVQVDDDGKVTFITRYQRKFKDLIHDAITGSVSYCLHIDRMTVNEFNKAMEGTDLLEYGSPVFVTAKKILEKLAGEAKLVEGEFKLGTGEVFLWSTPEAYPRYVLRLAIVEMRNLAKDELERERKERKEAERVERLGFTPTGKSARRQIAVSALAAHMTSLQLNGAIEAKTPGGGKHQKDDRFVTKAETRMVDGKKLTGKQLRKMQKKMRQAERNNHGDQ